MGKDMGWGRMPEILNWMCKEMGRERSYFWESGKKGEKDRLHKGRVRVGRKG